MKKTKPVEIIFTLSPDELKDLDAFVRSPYFNTNKKLIKLYDVIRKKLDKIQAEKITEEQIFAEVFPGKEYNYAIVKNLTSALASVLEDFLVINAVRTKPINRVRNRVILMDEYDSRLLDHHFNKTIRRTKSELDEQLIDNNYYADYTMFEEGIYFFNSSRSDERALEDAIYNEVIYSLCDFYRKFSRSMWKIDISIGNLNSRYDKNFIALLDQHIAFEKLAEEMKGIDEKAHGYILLNTLLIKMLVKPEDVSSYYQMKKLLNDTIDRYENYERFSIFSKLVSYCSTMFRNGNAEFINEALYIRMLMMEKVKFNHEGLGPLNFHHFAETILMITVEQGAPTAEEVLNKYINIIGEDKRDISFNLSMAHIHEARGNNDEAIEHLVKIPHMDTDIKMWIKRLYIIIYYNTGQFETGLDSVNALKGFINTNKEMTEVLKKRYIDYAKIMEKMLKIKCSPEQYTAEDVENLHNEVNANSHIIRRMLLEKVSELKKIVEGV